MNSLENLEEYSLIRDRLIEWTASYCTFIQNFLLQSTDKEATSILRSSYTWRDIQDEATEALENYKKDGKSWRHPFQTTGRVFSDVASRLEFLLELLPHGEYTSILCGGLKLVFNVRSFGFLLKHTFLI